MHFPDRKLFSFFSTVKCMANAQSLLENAFSDSIQWPGTPPEPIYAFTSIPIVMYLPSAEGLMPEQRQRSDGAFALLFINFFHENRPRNGEENSSGICKTHTWQDVGQQRWFGNAERNTSPSLLFSGSSVQSLLWRIFNE